MILEGHTRERRSDVLEAALEWVDLKKHVD